MWYLHWLELRGKLFRAALFCGVYAVAFVTLHGKVEDSSLFRNALETPMARVLSSDAFLAWYHLTALSPMLSWIVALALAGDGVQTTWDTAGEAAVYYRFTLPVSRNWMIGSRLVLGGVACMLAVLLTLGGLAFASRTLWQEIPWTEVLGTLAILVPAAFAQCAALSGLYALFRSAWALLVWVPVMFVSLPLLWMAVGLYPGFGASLWWWILLTAVVSFVAIAFTISLGNTSEV